MREYEVIFILHPDLDENTINDSITKVKTWITDADGSIVKEDIWGKKRLAYEIQKQREGFYVLLHTQMEPTFIHELENSMKLMEPVMRYIVTKVE
ncbi:MAG: 30S ribosomal protein S6 [Anaerolineaceae bacterium]|nr:30S ribosomal protein S6 [Anaerolineaceae bacterium]